MRERVALLNSGDVDAMLRTFTPDFEVDWSESRGPARAVYRGEAAARWWLEWTEMFEEMRIEPLDFIDAGDHVVVPNRAHLRGRDGVEVEAVSAFVYTIRDGSIVGLRMYQDTDAALDAVGATAGRARTRSGRAEPGSPPQG